MATKRKKASQHGVTVAYLYMRWRDAAVAYAAHRLLKGDTATAEDLVQTVFVHLWEQRAVVEALAPAQQQSYLYRAVTNAAISLACWQRFAVRHPVPLSRLPENLECPAVVDDRDLTAAMIAQETWDQAARGLTTDQQEIVSLVGRGYSYPAVVAALHQRGATTIRSTATCVRTIKQFRAALREEVAA